MAYAPRSMLALFADILLPVILAAGTGYVAAARFDLDPRPLSRIAFNVLAPCLIFRVIVDSRIPAGEMLRMAGLTLVVLLASAALAGLVAHWLGCDRRSVTAVVLVVMLPNAGNFGLPTTLFAFGEAGLAQAGIFFIVASLLTFTLGVLVASTGRMRLHDALAGLLRVPAVWAILLAGVLTRSGQALPLPLDRTVELFSQASIPVFLLILGMQLRGNGLNSVGRLLVWTVAARLLLSPALALGLSGSFGLSAVARQAAVLESAMPCAVITIVLATEYDLEPRFVTTAVFVSTLLGPLTLTPLLALLGAGRAGV